MNNPEYEAVPCPKRGCYADRYVPCGSGRFGTHRARRQLWAATMDARSKGLARVFWNGGWYGVPK